MIRNTVDGLYGFHTCGVSQPPVAIQRGLMAASLCNRNQPFILFPTQNRRATTYTEFT